MVVGPGIPDYSGPRMKRFLLIAAALLVILILGAGIAARVFLGSRLTPDALVAAIESSNDCRAHITAVRPSLFSDPVKLTLREVLFLPRDDQAGSGIPLEDRAAPVFGQTGIRCDEAVIEVGLRDLLKGRLEVTAARLVRPVVRTVIDRDGRSSVNDLFEEAPEVAVRVGDAVPEPSAWGRAPVLEADQSFVAGERDGEDEEAELDRFHASDLPLPASLERAVVEDGRIDCFLENPRAFLRFLDIQGELRDVDIDPDDLAGHNRAFLGLATTLTVDGPVETAPRFVELKLRTAGEVTPFEPVTGYLDPNMVYDVVLENGSWVQALPLLEQLGGAAEPLREIGLEMDRLFGKSELQGDVSVKVGFFEKKVRLAEAAVFAFDAFDLELEKGSWVETGNSTHSFEGRLTASKEVTEESVAGVSNWVAENTTEKLAEFAREAVIEPLLDEGRIALAFKSTGRLGAPDLEIENKVRDFGDVLKEAGKKLLKDGGIGDLLKGLFGN